VQIIRFHDRRFDMMPMYKKHKCNKLELMARDLYNDLYSVFKLSSKKHGDKESEFIKHTKELRRLYRRGELTFCDGDPEDYFAKVIRGEIKSVTARWQDD